MLEVLTFVVREYVVDGPPPMLLHQVEDLADLRGLSFAQLVTALQTRLDHPELTLFAVDGEQVSVRVGGAMHPLAAGRTPLAPTSPVGAAVAATPAAADLPRPAAGVRIVEAGIVQAPRPAAGISLRGAPTATPVATPAAAPVPAPAPAVAAAAAAADKPADKPAAPGDDASARFSLLELD